jgi:16S rRNA (uracil1498-N3)-methyltransferase
LHLKNGSLVRVFNERQGEFDASLKIFPKSAGVLPYHCCKAAPKPSGTLALAFSPLKPQPSHFLIEKATELGVTHFQPLWMERTQARPPSLEKWKKIAQSAAEQCERMTLPQWLPFETSLHFFKQPALPHLSWFGALERETAQTLPAFIPFPCDTGLLVGPEGGFSSTEKQNWPAWLTPLNLGPFILRAETAALCALSWMRAFQKDFALCTVH